MYYNILLQYDFALGFTTMTGPQFDDPTRRFGQRFSTILSYKTSL